MSSATPASASRTEFDVLIIGAGLSGIGATHYLRQQHPEKTFTILEQRPRSGGTWDLFRYPGIRSDSDLNTYGYEFKPWKDRHAIADGAKILDYIREAAHEDGLDEHIRYHHRAVRASWSSRAARWSVEIEVGAPDRPRRTEVLTAKWIFCAGGYFRHDEGYTPQFPGREDFAGQVVHPQNWPAGLDYSGKRVVVIGSGATAMTLLPAMLAGPRRAAHVTMLQRTPTYVMSLSREDRIANVLRAVLGDKAAYPLIRRKNIAISQFLWRYSRKNPKQMRKAIRRANVKQLPKGYDVDTHFNPPYNPWDQRLCLVPDGDFFAAIRAGRASVVTDRIARFTPTGIQLESGQHLDADVIVTATGLNLQMLGGMQLVVDGAPVPLSETIAYRGTMLSGVPNLAFAVGYTNSSWTLKIGLLADWFCRLLGYMDEHHYEIVRAIPGPGIQTRPILDFGAGYVQRSVASMPKQGTASPWLTSMNYPSDRRLLRGGKVVDEFLHFSTRKPETADATGRLSTVAAAS